MSKKVGFVKCKQRAEGPGESLKKSQSSVRRSAVELQHLVSPRQAQMVSTEDCQTSRVGLRSSRKKPESEKPEKEPIGRKKQEVAGEAPAVATSNSRVIQKKTKATGKDESDTQTKTVQNQILLFGKALKPDITQSQKNGGSSEKVSYRKPVYRTRGGDNKEAEESDTPADKPTATKPEKQPEEPQTEVTPSKADAKATKQTTVGVRSRRSIKTKEEDLETPKVDNKLLQSAPKLAKDVPVPSHSPVPQRVEIPKNVKIKKGTVVIPELVIPPEMQNSLIPSLQVQSNVYLVDRNNYNEPDRPRSVSETKPREVKGEIEQQKEVILPTKKTSVLSKKRKKAAVKESSAEESDPSGPGSPPKDKLQPMVLSSVSKPMMNSETIKESAVKQTDPPTKMAIQQSNAISRKSSQSSNEHIKIGSIPRSNDGENLFHEDRRRMEEIEEEQDVAPVKSTRVSQAKGLITSVEKKDETPGDKSLPINIDEQDDKYRTKVSQVKKSKFHYSSEDSNSGRSNHSDSGPKANINEREKAIQSLMSKWDEKRNTTKATKGTNQQAPKKDATRGSLVKEAGTKAPAKKKLKSLKMEEEDSFEVPPQVPGPTKLKGKKNVVSEAPPSIEQISAGAFEKLTTELPTPAPNMQLKPPPKIELKRPQNTTTSAIKRPMRPHIVMPKKVKRKRQRSDSESFDDYGEAERSISEDSSDQYPIGIQKRSANKNTNRNRRTVSRDSEESGEAPRKRQKKEQPFQKRKQIVQDSISSSNLIEDEQESLSQISPPEKITRKKPDPKPIAKPEQKPMKPLFSSGSLGQSQMSAQSQAKPMVFNSLKERLAALQSEIKRAEKIPEGQPLTRVEPVVSTFGQMSLAQSRISQLISSTVSNPTKSIVTELINNARLNKAEIMVPPSCIFARSNQLASLNNTVRQPPTRMEVESEPSVVESKPPPKTPDTDNNEFKRPAPVQSVASNDQLYESNVNRYLTTSERGQDLDSQRNMTNPPIFPKDQICTLPMKVCKSPAGLPTQFIVSRVMEDPAPREPPQTLSTSRLQRIIQQRRVNHRTDPTELPGLFPRAAIPTSAVNTQASAHASRQIGAPNAMVPLVPSRVQPSKPPEKKYAKLCQLFTKEGYEVMIEQNAKDISAFYPNLLVAVSPQQRQYYKQYGDLLHFQIFGQSYQHCRLGVFSVFNCNRQPLLAGYAIIFSSSFDNYQNIIQFFLNIQGGEPETILTNHQPEIIQTMNYLQREGIFNGAHVYSAKDVISILEREIFGVLSFNDRAQKTEPFQRFITERNREVASQYEEKILELCRTFHREETKWRVEDLLASKEKICYSWLPFRFVGVGMILSREFYNVINASYRAHQSNNHETMAKELIQLDVTMKNDETKVVIYNDPIENVFHDERLYTLRMGLDYVVFKAFLKNYVESFCHIVLDGYDDRMLKKGNFDILDKRNNQRLKVASWKCPCKDELKTGIGCLHVITGARIMGDFDYLNLVRKRWKSESIIQRIVSSESEKTSTLRPPATGYPPMSNPTNAASKPAAKKTAPPSGKGKIFDFDEIELNSDQETELVTLPIAKSN